VLTYNVNYRKKQLSLVILGLAYDVDVFVFLPTDTGPQVLKRNEETPTKKEYY